MADFDIRSEIRRLERVLPFLKSDAARKGTEETIAMLKAQDSASPQPAAHPADVVVGMLAEPQPAHLEPIPHDKLQDMLAAEQSHAEGAREWAAQLGVNNPIIVKLLDDYAASRLRALKPFVSHKYVATGQCPAVQARYAITSGYCWDWRDGDEATCTCGLARALKEGESRP